MFTVAFLLAALAANPPSIASQIPFAIYTDPVHDMVNPAQMEVLHIPSGDVQINGVAYLAAGSGPHPTIIICHGLPGNEKNLDLAQALRRAGWNAITFNYRGSWGTPGSFRFAQNPEDARAVLAYLRVPENARRLGVDTSYLVIAGHSMGGWVSAMVSSNDDSIRGTILISSGNLGKRFEIPRAQLVARMADNMEALVGTTAEAMAEELNVNAAAFDYTRGAAGLANKPMLVLSSDDGLAPQSDALVAAVNKAGGKQVTAVHVATDHSWSDRRIRLQSEVLNWLAKLK